MNIPWIVSRKTFDKVYKSLLEKEEELDKLTLDIKTKDAAIQILVKKNQDLRRELAELREKTGAPGKEAADAGKREEV